MSIITSKDLYVIGLWLSRPYTLSYNCRLKWEAAKGFRMKCWRSATITYQAYDWSTLCCILLYCNHHY